MKKGVVKILTLDCWQKLYEWFVRKFVLFLLPKINEEWKTKYNDAVGAVKTRFMFGITMKNGENW
jgi:hypothetical protein